MGVLRRYRRRARRALVAAWLRGRETLGYGAAALLRPWSRAAGRYWLTTWRERRRREKLCLARFCERRPDVAVAITCSGRHDGAGGQALAVMSAIAFALNHGCRYLHTPFWMVFHVQGDVERWRQRWEAFFNLGHGEETLPADAVIVRLPEYARMIRHSPAGHPGARLVCQWVDFDFSELMQPATMALLRARLRAKYFASDKSTVTTYRRAGAINVAVHLRRGDVGLDHGRYTHDGPSLATIAALHAVAASIGRTAAINVFSEGALDQFAPYAAAGCVLHIGTDPFEAFHNLVVADVLVTASSQFSRAAAMLSNGIVINQTDRWGRDERWLKRTRDGRFDGARLAQLLGQGSGISNQESEGVAPIFDP